MDPAAADEERQYGRVPRRLYWLYAKSCGLALTLCYFVGSFVWQVTRLLTDYWLVSAVESRHKKHQSPVPDARHVLELPVQLDDGTTTGYYLKIFLISSVVSIVAALLANILGQVRCV